MYAVFQFIWNFCIPIIVFVFAYWKMLIVVRRQAKLEADRRKVTGKATEPVARTSRSTTEMAEMTPKTLNNAKSENGPDKKEAEPKATPKGKGDGQPRSSGLSQAKINVMKTMIYIVICFIICWMPKSVYLMYKKFTVTFMCFFG